jgi:hypothetical protein
MSSHKSRFVSLFDMTTFVVKCDHKPDLRSKARQRLLAYYVANAAARHFLRDMASPLSIDLPVCNVMPAGRGFKMHRAVAGLP